MVMGITAEEDEDDNDKESLTRRREMIRSRLEKESMFEDDDVRHHRGGDIVSRWRDKRPTSPVQYKVSQIAVSLLACFSCYNMGTRCRKRIERRNTALQAMSSFVL